MTAPEIALLVATGLMILGIFLIGLGNVDEEEDE